jgi:hypothetical protein
MYLVDRGERIVSGQPRRVCFVETLSRSGELRLLAKVRFSVKNDMTDRMQIKSYSAIKDMVLGAFSKNPQEAASREALALKTVDQQLGQHRGPAKVPVNAPYGLAGYSSML